MFVGDQDRDGAQLFAGFKLLVRVERHVRDALGSQLIYEAGKGECSRQAAWGPRWIARNPLQ